MTDTMHQQLLGHLLGALDDEEQSWLEARLEVDEQYRGQWLFWRRRLSPLLSARPEFEPPPLLAERTCRLVAACSPMIAPRKKTRQTMTPDRALPGRAAPARRLDIAVLVLVALAIVAIVPPAIHGSRFQSRIASCQNKLRQVGLALTQYGYEHQNALSELAIDKRLTEAGTHAVELLSDGLGNRECSEALFPVAWRAVQDVWPAPQAETASLALALPSAMPISNEAESLIVSSSDDWSDVGCNDPVADLADSTPVSVAVLADAPSAAMPGQGLECHGGLGHNQFFDDGHVVFLPRLASRDATERRAELGL